MDKEAREVVNINRKHFLMIGSSFGVPWFVLGSSLVFYREGIREVQRKGILRKVLFSKKYPNHSGVINKDKQGTACDAVLINKDRQGNKLAHPNEIGD